jgi:toxin-antitoxin system, toxin component, fic family
VIISNFLFANKIQSTLISLLLVLEEGESQEKADVQKFQKTVAYNKPYLTTFYNLDMIIALGYRVHSSPVPFQVEVVCHVVRIF